MDNLNIKRPRNIVYIVVDCLRPDFIHSLGHKKDITPFIDELMKEGIYFDYCFSAGNNTVTAYPSILSSSHPFMFGGYSRFNPERKPIAEILKKDGFITAGFHSNPFLVNGTGYERGFDFFCDNITTQKRNKIKRVMDEESKIYKIVYRIYDFIFGHKKKPYTEAEELTEQVKNWINENFNSSFFLWVHYMDPHPPFVPPKRIMNGLIEEDIKKSELLNLWKKMEKTPDEISPLEIELIKKLYECEIRHVDKEIREIYKLLKEKDIAKDTTFIITADHGINFKEHNDLTISPKVYDEAIKVPLLLKLPNINKSFIDKRLVSLQDVCPTILDLVGIETPKEYNGIGLVGDRFNEFVISGTCNKKATGADFNKENMVVSIRNKNFKYIINNQLQKEEFYDLAIDREEKDNIINKNLKECVELKNKLNSWLGTIKSQKTEEEKIKESLGNIKI
ncbi:sulfatase [Candidatus Woesearchaeota archaeon]|nr:sulfatase [Candidatus Woesearchaeota archaeon]